MKKWLSILTSTLLVCTMFAGCSGSNNQSSNASSQSSPAPAVTPEANASTEEPAALNEALPDDVKIKFSLWDLASGGRHYEEIVEAFEEEFPHIKVELVDIPSADYTAKLSMMLNGGSDVDALLIKDGDTTKNIAEKGQLMDLTEYIERDGVDLSEFNGLAERFIMDDKIVALPSGSSYYVLFYNKDIFDEAGVPYPTNGMTWFQWEELCEQLTSGSGVDKKYGGLLHTWNACVQNWGVQDGKHTIMDTDYTFFKPYYEMALRLQNDGYIMDYSTLKSGNIHYSGPFLQGNIATMPMGNWFIGLLAQKIDEGESDVNWGVVQLPHGDDVPAGYTVGGVTPIAINELSKNKDAAWEFVNFLTSEKGAEIYAKNFQFPGRINDDILEQIVSAEGMPEGLKEGLEITNISLDRPLESMVPEVDKMLDSQHSLIMLEEVTIDEGLEEMSRLSEEIQGK